MKAVTKDEFYNSVGKLDVILKLSGNYPYLCQFIIRHSGKEAGRHDPQGQYWIA